MSATLRRSRSLSADDLLEGARLTRRVEIPRRLLEVPENRASEVDDPASIAGSVELRPLTLRDVMTVARAAKGDGPLTSLLMLQQSLVEPRLTSDQISELPAGLVQHLLEEVHRMSGLQVERDEIAEAVRDPMAKACFLLAREFGWSPEHCADLTVSQILMYLEMLERSEPVPSASGTGSAGSVEEVP